MGVKSTALKFGEATPVWLGGFSVAMVTALLATGCYGDMGGAYYVSVAAVAALLTNQVRNGRGLLLFVVTVAVLPANQVTVWK